MKNLLLQLRLITSTLELERHAHVCATSLCSQLTSDNGPPLKGFNQNWNHVNQPVIRYYAIKEGTGCKNVCVWYISTSHDSRWGHAGVAHPVSPSASRPGIPNLSALLDSPRLPRYSRTRRSFLIHPRHSQREPPHVRLCGLQLCCCQTNKQTNTIKYVSQPQSSQQQMIC